MGLELPRRFLQGKRPQPVFPKCVFVSVCAHAGVRRCAPACVLLHGACAPLRHGPCPHRAWTDNSDLCSMVTRWAEASTPRILFLLWRRQWSWTGAKPADADTMLPAWRNSQQPQIAVTGRVPPPAVGPRWPRPVHGAGPQDGDAEAALESYWRGSV